MWNIEYGIAEDLSNTTSGVFWGQNIFQAVKFEKGSFNSFKVSNNKFHQEQYLTFFFTK